MKSGALLNEKSSFLRGVRNISPKLVHHSIASDKIFPDIISISDDCINEHNIRLCVRHEIDIIHINRGYFYTPLHSLLHHVFYFFVAVIASAAAAIFSRTSSSRRAQSLNLITYADSGLTAFHSTAGPRRLSESRSQVQYADELDPFFYFIGRHKDPLLMEPS